MVHLFKALLPFLMKTVLGGLSVEISKADLERLKEYEGRPMLLLPNHPTYLDPYVMFELSKRLGETFQYVCARELFDLDRGLRGKIFQSLGVYSVIRGAADRESFRTSKEILAKGLNRLVIFIEGEVSHENDTLIPFEPGVIQLAFWALEERLRQAKKDPSALSTGSPDVYLAPVAIKYIMKSPCHQAIEQSIHQLTTAVGLSLPADMPRYQKILEIGQTVLTIQEKRLNLHPSPEDSITERLERFKDRLLTKMELFLDIAVPPQTTILDRIRAIRNAMDKQIYTYQDPPSLSPYAERMLEHVRLEFQEFYLELEKVVNMLVLKEGYIHENETPERYVDVLRRLEREVFGKPLINPPRTAVIKVGNIQNLMEAYPAYETSKKQTVQGIANQLEAEMYTLLDKIQSHFPFPPEPSLTTPPG
jgi:1-acyl-sn-glycerol-3-phosphate acyltransferase